LGFVGSNLAHELVRLGANVSIVDSLLPYGGGNKFNIQQIKNKIELKIADVNNQSLINKIVKGKDFIFNLVWQVSHIYTMENPISDLEANCKAHLSILEACMANPLIYQLLKNAKLTQ
jgi:nucleoside-diphosphate-sugar epimerase